jgi:dTDP-4-amino-4,6-dideoxygalactose transaminase
MIPVTKCFLPPIELYTQWVQRAYDKQWLTNRGELVQLLEERLKGYLGVDWMTVTNNGTSPLQIALKLLGKGGEIITTPFSYVATTASIVWENCTPVFVDIHPEYLTIDEKKIEAAITDKTTCILATHVFGNPCAVEAIEVIAKKHNLHVIYDAAHAFGVKYNGQSVFNYGDVSTCSFHATKLFHTGEGGAMFASSPELRHQLYYSHNFGHNGPLDFHGLGINGKSSELHAAMGLAVFPFIDEIISSRKDAVVTYDRLLDFSRIKKMKVRENTDWNYSYYPVLFSSEEELLAVQQRMNEKDIFPRRYFYPSLNTIPFSEGEKMPVSENVASRILCLPLYANMELADLDKIIYLINEKK